MSEYLRKYASREAYENDVNKPVGTSSVSLAGIEPAFDGCNVIIPYVSIGLEVGDEKLYDKYEGKPKILKHGTYNAATFDASRYVRSESFYLCSFADRDVFVYKKCIGTQSNSYHGGAGDGSELWAASNEYKVTLDLSANGGFSYTCAPYSATISGSCSWTAGATIASVVAQLTTGSGLGIASISETEIRFRISTSSNGSITFSDTTGTIVLDCSFSARIGINGTPRGSHCGFQCQSVLTCFPSLKYVAASSVCYCRSGNNSSYRTSIDPDTFKSYHTNSGGAAFAAESVAGPMRKSVWDALATDEDTTHKALYDKYNGDYDQYLLSRRIAENICKGVGSTCREQSMEYTYALANCYFTDAEGNTKHVYPAAAICAAHGISVDGVTSGFEPGNFYFNGCVELCEMLSPEKRSILNAAINTTTGGQQLALRAQWSCGECHSNSAWFYNPTYGALSLNYKYNACQVRPLLASPRV